MRVAECVIIQDLGAPKKCHSLFHHSTGESGGKVEVIGFFPLKIVPGKYFNIFHHTIVVYLYYNCHQDPYPPPIQRAADVLCFFFFMRMSPALLKTARCVC